MGVGRSRARRYDEEQGTRVTFDDVARQYLNAGLLDEVRLHIAPIILGEGTRLFDGVRTDVRLVPREAQNAPPTVTHLIYDFEGATRDAGS
jgi:dihydrofolate reductase